MTDYAYGPGGWTALAHGGRAALLDPAIASDAVDRIWASLSDGGPLETWLEVLAGNGLAALPSFGFVEPADDGVRVVVRGGVAARVEDYEISAGGMRTWREHVAPAGTGVVLSVESGDAEYPLVGGIVLASVLHIGDVASPESADAAVVADEAMGDTDGADASVADADAPVDAALVDEPPVEDVAVDESAAESTEGEDVDAPSESEESAQTDDQSGVDVEPEPSEDVAEAEQSEDAEPVEGDEPSFDAWSESAESVQLEELPSGEEAAGDELEQSEAVDHEQEAAAHEQPAEAAAEPAPWATPAQQQPDPWAVPPAPVADVSSQWGPPPAPSEGSVDASAEPVVDDAVADEAAPAGDHDGFTIRATELPEHQSVDHTLAPAQEEQAEVDSSSATPGAQLSLSTGQQVELDRPVLIGRAPESSRFGFGETPRLVTVPSPQQDISRTHVEIKSEGDHVLVTDLRSTNGTVVVLPGSPPRRLHPGESVPVPPGTVIDLGDGVTAVVAVPDATAPMAY